MVVGESGHVFCMEIFINQAFSFAKEYFLLFRSSKHWQNGWLNSTIVSFLLLDLRRLCFTLIRNCCINQLPLSLLYGLHYAELDNVWVDTYCLGSS